MSNTIYFHFGTPKTGTSAIQDFLIDNNSLLGKSDFIYPQFNVKFPEIGANRNGHFLYYVRGERYQEEYKICMEGLKKAMEDKKNIILSDEGLWYWQTNPDLWSHLKAWAADMQVDVKVIVYLRRQEELIESLWNQKIKGFRKWTETFEEFLQSDYYERLPLDYERALARIEEFSGKGNLIVRLYDFSQFYHGNIYEDFLDILGIPMTEEFVLRERVSNSSMPLDAIEVKRMINSNHSYKNCKDLNFYKKIINRAYDQSLSTGKKERESIITGEELQEIRERYRKGNEHVARKYFGRDDGILFPERPNMKEWTLDERKLLAESVKILSGADLYLYQEIEELRGRVQKLEKKLAAHTSAPAPPPGLLQRVKRKLGGN